MTYKYRGNYYIQFKERECCKMNFNKKSNLINILILVVPVIIMFLLIPILPDKVPFHWNISGVADRFIDKKFSFVLGVIPFVIYESIKIKYSKK